MTYPLADRVAAGPPPTRISVRVWRLVAGTPQWLFTYAGAVDDSVLRAVMQHVRQLTRAVPGDWTVEVVGLGLRGGLLESVRSDLTDLRRGGLRPRLAHARPARPSLRDLLGGIDVTPPPPTTVH